MTHTTRPELLESTKRALREGIARIDPQAAEFVAVYDGLLRSFAASRKVNCPPELIDDVVVAVWIDICRLLPDFEYDPRKGRFRTWLFRIVRSKTIDEVRKKTRSRKEQDGLGTGFWDKQPDDESASGLEALEAAFEKEVAQVIWQEYRKSAPPKELEVVELCMVRNLTPKQAAEQLAISGEAARQSLTRGRKHLRRIGAALFGADVA